MNLQKAKRLVESAHEAGLQAGKSVECKNMIVADGGKVHIVPDGPCGFAYIHIKSANSNVAKAMIEILGAMKSDSYGGLLLSVDEFDQSVTRKNAYARAFAKVLAESGMKKVYLWSRYS